MRLGVIDSVAIGGDVVKVNVRIQGDVEPEIVLLALLGQGYEPTKGDIVLVLPFDGAEGEHAALPCSYRPASATTDFVALKQDVDALDARTSALEQNVQLHIHNVPLPSPIAPTPTTTPFVPPPIVAPPAVDPFPGTSATLKGSDRLKVTHE